ncbi:hypothetical protein OH76DRAFT_1366326, partial [Lentinus brumalis]
MNEGPHALDIGASTNVAFLEQEEWLLLMFIAVSELGSLGSRTLRKRAAELRTMVTQEWARMQIHKEREWRRQKRTQAECKRTGAAYEMKGWLARLLSRKNIEVVMDEMLKRAVGAAKPIMTDLWDAPVFRELRTEDGKRFVDAPPGESRLILGLSIDGFNPFQNKEAKQDVTVSGIYVYCLNLPPHLRYRPENMYLVGVIP